MRINIPVLLKRREIPLSNIPILTKKRIGENMTMNFSQAIYKIISDIDKTYIDNEKKSAWSSIVMQIKKSGSFSNKFSYIIENRIVGFIDRISDEEKISIYNETETGMAGPVDMKTAIISQVEFDLQMELLNEVTKELFEYVENSMNK
jgi:predicted RNA-binding protein (virulence factor B family)